MPHGYTDVYLIGTDNPLVLWVKFTKGLGIALLIREREQKLMIFFHEQHSDYLAFFNG